MSIDPKTLCDVPEVVKLAQHIRRLVAQCPQLAMGLASLSDPEKVESQEDAICRDLEAVGFVAYFGNEDVGKSKRKPKRLLAVGKPAKTVQTEAGQ
jgi:hypothetical protein